MAQRPLLSAVSTSARQLLLLLRCLPASSKAHIRLSPEGLRVSTAEGSAMEAFVFVEKALFSSYSFTAEQEDDSDNNHTVFQVDLNALTETFVILTLSDAPIPRQSATTEAYAAHRLNRHAGLNSFANSAFGMNGICTITYDYEGAPLSVHMSDAGVTTTCDLTTYSAQITEDIPFSRDSIAVKTIMRSSFLLDAISELAPLNPTHITFTATPPSRPNAGLKLMVSGTLGSAKIEFATDTKADEPILETFNCSEKISASFRFSLIKSALRAMGTASKVSLRLDQECVLSMQFLVELEAGTTDKSMAFIDFKVVPLVEGEAEDDDGDSSSDGDDASRAAPDHF